MSFSPVDLSIIIPAYNEEGNLSVLAQKIVGMVTGLVSKYEIIIVNDGSTDGTEAVVNGIMVHNPSITLINLSRNFGHQAALNAGLEYSSGKAVITMDADLQHPVEKIPEFYRAHVGEGYDIVLGQRKNEVRKGSVKSLLSSVFYSMLKKMTSVDIKPNVADFNLYSRSVVNALLKLPEKDRFLRGLVQWVGFKKMYLSYTVGERFSGKSKYTFHKMISLAVSGITSFSAFPLRIAWWLGLTVSLFGFGYAIFILAEYLLYPSHIINGWTSSIIVTLILGGTQLVILGILGEYVAKVFHEVKGRPSYVVKSIINRNEPSKEN